MKTCPTCGALPCDQVNNPIEQVEKVRRAVFNILPGEATPNTSMIIAAVYEALKCEH